MKRGRRAVRTDQVAEATLHGLLEAAPDAILGIDASGAVVYANIQVERLFGYSRSELIGQPVEILVPDLTRSVHPSDRERYLRDPRPRPMGAGMEFAGRRKDGTEFPAEISLGALETEEGVLISAAVHDVSDRLRVQAERDRLRGETEQERLEKQQQQSQRLESLGQLAGGVAHDFNNLLGVILLYASLIAHEVNKAGEDGPEGHARWDPVSADVDRINQAANRAKDLTHQLLAFARREVVRPRVISLNSMVGHIEELLRRTLGEHVELLIRLTPDAWPIVADPNQIEQVLINLAVNAADSMPGGGRLTIDTENVLVDEVYASSYLALVTGRYLRLRISDSGAGMDADTLEHAFEPFFTTKPKGEGTGLGLAMVYGVVTQAGGTVRLYSKLGIGTTFSALFPATDVVPESTELAPAREGGLLGGHYTVLVVEDEEALRQVICRILKRHGFEVIDAASGPEALAKLERLPEAVDLLLTDVVMPKMLGKELAERLTGAHPHLRVLFMSGYAFPVLTSQAQLPEGVALIEKPFTEEQLLRAVSQVFDARG